MFFRFIRHVEKTITLFAIQIAFFSQLMDEINAYDAKTKEQEKNLLETSQIGDEHTINIKIKDYKKTSLLKYVTVFNEFLRGLQTTARKNKEIENGKMRCRHWKLEHYCLYYFLGNPMEF